MNIKPRIALAPSLGLLAGLALSSTAHAQLAFGVDATGSLFSFSVATPGSVSTIGSLGFVPDAIDFRPEPAGFVGASRLYAIDVNSTTGAAQLYTVNTTTGAATAVGVGFSTAKLIGATDIGFDFNPTTLQGDTSIRIRLTANNQANLRLHSDTGSLAATDTDLSAAGVVGSAYTNSNIAVLPANGTTTLFDINATTDFLVSQVPPNNGTLNNIGSGLGIDAGIDLGFDIYSGGSTNTGYIADTTGANSALFYSVNLATGTASLVGSVPRDFTGGFSIDPVSAIPEPSAFAAMAGTVGLGLAALRRRRAVRA